jgi:hypothetical protein
VGWDETGWHAGSFWNGLKASRYFLAPLTSSRNVLYYYYYYILKDVLHVWLHFNACYLNYYNVFIGLRWNTNYTSHIFITYKRGKPSRFCFNSTSRTDHIYCINFPLYLHSVPIHGIANMSIQCRLQGCYTSPFLKKLKCVADWLIFNPEIRFVPFTCFRNLIKSASL